MAKKKKKPEVFEDTEILNNIVDDTDRIETIEEVIEVEKPVKKEKPIKFKKTAPVELKERNSISDYIYIYKGPMLRIKVFGIRFDRQVPTYVKNPDIIAKLEAMEGFEKFEDQKSMTTLGSRIMVRMPLTLEGFIAACTVVERISEVFPRNKILCIGSPAYKNLIPESVHYNSQTVKEDFYREFDLSENKLKNYWLTPYTLSIEPMHKSILKASGFFQFGIDDEIKPYKKQIPNLGKYKAVVLCDDSDFSKFVQDQFESKDILFMNKDNIDYREFINTGKVVSLYDTEYTIVASYLGLDTMVFIDENIFKRETQFKAYGAEVFVKPSDEDYEKAISVIKSFI